ncbi:MAG: amino acid-binding protein [Rhodospirillales bacterium]|nr:amino acid-binding protein [Rhodospirillales bacterium]
MPIVALVSILCLDRVGLVSSVADFLFSVGVNLRDTTFAVYGSGAEFSSVCELPDGVGVNDIEQGLARLPELEGAELRVAPFVFDPTPGPAVRITHRIEVGGGDQLGLIARLSEIFAQFGANIVRLDAQKLPAAEGGRYVTRFAVSLPPDRAETCLSAIANTAGSLGLESSAVESAN